jgi:hypothetical protein
MIKVTCKTMIHHNADRTPTHSVEGIVREVALGVRMGNQVGLELAVDVLQLLLVDHGLVANLVV